MFNAPRGANFFAKKLNSKIGDNLPSDMAVVGSCGNACLCAPLGAILGTLLFFFANQVSHYLQQSVGSEDIPLSSSSSCQCFLFSSYSPKTFSRCITLKFRIVQAPSKRSQGQRNCKKKSPYPTGHPPSSSSVAHVPPSLFPISRTFATSRRYLRHGTKISNNNNIARFPT